MYKTIKMTKYIINLYKRYSQTCFSDHRSYLTIFRLKGHIRQVWLCFYI